MDQIPFELVLVDSVAGPAKRAADAVRTLETQAKKAQKALSFGDDLGKAEAGLRKLAADPAGFVRMVKAPKELAEQRKKLKESAGLSSPEGFGGAIGSKLSFSRLAGAAVVGEIIGEGIIGAGEKLLDIVTEAAHAFVEVFTEGFKKAVEESSKAEVLQLGYRLSLGDKGGGAALGNIAGFAGRTGFDDDKIANMLIPLRRAGLDQQASRTAFAAAGDVAAGEGRGGDAGRVSELLEGFKKIRLKGGVSDKLLTSLGVDSKEFYEDLAKQLGVSVKEAKKQASAEEGKVDPQRLLNTIYSGIEKRQGGELGTGVEAYADTMQARLTKLQDLPNQYLKTMVQSPAFGKLSDSFGAVLEKLNPDGPTGQRIIATLQGMFTKIVGWFDKLTSDEGLDAMTNVIENIVDGMSKAVDLATMLVHAFTSAAEISIKIASPITDAIKISKKLAGASPEQGPEDFTETLKRKYAAGEISLDDVKKKVSEYADAGGPAVAKSLGKAVDVSAPIQLNYHAAPGEDATHTAQKMAQEVGRHLVGHVERAAQESGAQ